MLKAIAFNRRLLSQDFLYARNKAISRYKELYPYIQGILKLNKEDMNE